VLKPTLKILLRNWWPVVVWLVVIRAESTESASASNTTQILYNVIAFFFPHIQPPVVERLDAVVRKTGHFAGYAILAALVVLALRNTNRDRLRDVLRRPWGVYLRDRWRKQWALLGVLVTAVTASLDEIHQSFLPSRTGMWQDVVLDTCGAVVMVTVMYSLAARAVRLQRQAEPWAEARILQ
jgi:VanZ family protein